jgi:hypothetical protein
LIQAQISPLLIGTHGCGKTESVKQFCQENGYEFRIVNLGNQEVGDIVGLPMVSARSTDFSPPAWITELIEFAENNPDRYAVIFLDEINRARRDVLQAVFPLILERRMHTLHLPKNVYVIAAMNPATDDYVVTDLADNALLSRFCHIRFSPSKLEWFEYMKEKKANASLVEFFQEQPEFLDPNVEEFELVGVKPDRRKAEQFSRLMATDIGEDLMQEVAYGMFGPIAASALLAHLKKAEKPISGLLAITQFDEVKDKIISWCDFEKGIRMDLIDATIKDVEAEIKKMDKNISDVERANVLKLLKIVPKEVCFGFVRGMIMVEWLADSVSKDKEIMEILKAAKVEKKAA